MAPESSARGASIAWTLPVAMAIQIASSAANLAPAVAAPALMQRLQLAPTAVGMYVTVVFVAAMVSAQLGPALVRRWGPIRTSQSFLFLSMSGLLLVAVPQRLAALAGAVLIGLGCGPIVPAGAEVLSRVTSPARYALVFSVRQTGVPLGGVLAGLLVPGLLFTSGVAAAMTAMAACCLLALAVAEILRAGFDDRRDVSYPFPGLRSLMKPIAAVMSDPTLRPVAFASIALAGTQVCVTSYLVTFLTHDLHWDIVTAGAGLAVAQLAGVLGRIAWGMVADTRLGCERTMRIITLAMAASAVAVLLLPRGTWTPVAVMILALLGATAIGWNGLFFAMMARAAPQGQVALTAAGGVFFTYFGVVIFPATFGWAAAAIGSHGAAYALLAAPLLLVTFFMGRQNLTKA